MMPLSSDFSVLMSVYKNDNPEHLSIALNSIYQEQTLKPQQVVIVADGELTLEQLSIISNFTKSVNNDVVKFVQLPQNRGLAKALNEGLTHCRYEIVARMDSDDIALPSRFYKQIHYMATNPDVDVCGTLIDEIETDSGEYISTRRVPLTHNEIKIFARKRSAVSHPSVVFKKSKVLAVGGYPLFRKSQDFALWSLLLVNNAVFANLDEVLLRMRTGRDLMARRGLSYLKYEYQVMLFQRKIGFITTAEFIQYASIRTVFRILPERFKKMLYAVVRKKQG
ncbi:glycosyltransferase [Pseudescherichia sp.]|uniref:glycosyltransferase n=1 Tax=Pseudescherichia sp. TaxID=2055881 RepID=UPI00289DC692|nr:glycosyltransferase [Pseudescherichia sp.]